MVYFENTTINKMTVNDFNRSKASETKDEKLQVRIEPLVAEILHSLHVKSNPDIDFPDFIRIIIYDYVRLSLKNKATSVQTCDAMYPK